VIYRKELQAGGEFPHLDVITAISSECAPHRVMRSRELQATSEIPRLDVITGSNGKRGLQSDPDARNYRQEREFRTWV